MKASFIYAVVIAIALGVLFYVNQQAGFFQPASDLSENKQEQLILIDKEINTISQELSSLRVKVMDVEMKAQSSLLEQPGKFTQELQDAAKNKEIIEQLQKRLQVLYDQKQRLLQEPSQ